MAVFDESVLPRLQPARQIRVRRETSLRKFYPRKEIGLVTLSIERLVFRAFKVQYNMRKMRENMLLLSVINKFNGVKTKDEELQAAEMHNLNRNFMIDFSDPLLKKIEAKKTRVELITKVRTRAHKIHNLFGHLVDTTKILETVEPERGAIATKDIEIYTTMHRVAAKYIWARWLESRRRFRTRDIGTQVEALS